MLVVIGCLRGVVGGLCLWQSQPEMGRVMCRWMQPAPPWFLNSSLVKPWGNGSAGVSVPGSHGPGIRGSFLSVTVGIANLNEWNGRRAPGYTNVNRIPTNPSSCKLKQVVTRDLNDIFY